MNSNDAVIDLLIVGGGINGTGIARDAAGRGLTVLLAEQDDLASHTSAASTKLIHGGLRYLEHGAFRLVRESLLERARLLRIAPHIIWPLSFVIQQAASPRPAWMIRLGLLFYDHLGGRKMLPASRTVDLAHHPLGVGLRQQGGRAFVYSDCWVDDSRLVVLNALDAAEKGAKVLVRTRLMSAKRERGWWTAILSSHGFERQVRARVLVNAAGPWVGDLFGRLQVAPARHRVRLIKGSHIVVPRLFEGKHAFLIQNEDRRVIFAIPYEGKFTLLGTTELTSNEPPGIASITSEEATYLLESANRTFARPVAAEDIRWTYSGVRPLLDDGTSAPSKLTRDYVLDLDEDGPPLLSVFGGKITTYRSLAERAMSMLMPFFPKASSAWTASQPLPGGDLPLGFDAYVAKLRAAYPDQPETLLHRLARSYGTRAERVLGAAGDISELGKLFGADLTSREVDYLIDNEWAQTAEDILFRRSKLGLHLSRSSADRLGSYIKSRLSKPD